MRTEKGIASAASRRSSQGEATIVGCFFLSGFTCLIYQVVWQRMIFRCLGATLPAVSIAAACIMAGFALGSSLFSRKSLQVKNPLLLYAVMEAAIALIAVVSSWLLSCAPGAPFNLYVNRVAHACGIHPENIFDAHFWLRTSYVAAVLILPSLLMGATFPLVGAALAQKSKGDKQIKYIWAYSLNLLGASLGSFACGLLLVPNLGLCKTLLAASCINLGVAVILLVTSRTGEADTRATSALETAAGEAQASAPALEPDKNNSGAPGDNRSAKPVLWILYLVAFAAGFTGMSLEVLWTRLFCLILGSSTYAVSAVLSAHLSGLALGAISSKRAIRLMPDGFRAIVLLQLWLAAWLYLDLALVGKIPWLLALTQSAFPASFALYIGQRIGLVFLIALLPAAITGGIFPFLLKASPASHSGLLFGINCGGAVVGALMTGLCFIPMFGRLFASGMETTIVVLAVLSLAGSAAAAWQIVQRARGNGAAAPGQKGPASGPGAAAPGQFAAAQWGALKAAPVAAVTLAVLLIFVRPHWNQALLSSGVSFLSLPKTLPLSASRFEDTLAYQTASGLLFYREGLNTTVTVNENRKTGIIYLKNDGKVEAALPLQKSLAGSDLATHVLMGQMPAIFHGPRPANVFVVGLGSGATCGAVLQNPEVEHVRIAEIEPAVYEAQPFFKSINGDPLRQDWLTSKRVFSCSDDARTLLQFSDTKYDIIISQPAEPWISGSADLYSQEFWKLGRDRLQDGGVFCQWIQLYSINQDCLGILCRTFETIFPQSYIIHYPGAGEIIMIGLLQPTTAGAIDQSWRRLRPSLPWLQRFVPDQKSLSDCLVLSPQSLADRCRSFDAQFSSRLNTDDNLLSEYILPAQLYSFGDSIETNLEALGVKDSGPARP